MKRRLELWDPADLDRLPDTRSDENAEPSRESPFGLCVRLCKALATMTKTEAWAAILMINNPLAPMLEVAKAARCSEATIRRAIDSLREAIAADEGGKGSEGPPPGRVLSPSSINRQGARRGARGKLTNTQKPKK